MARLDSVGDPVRIAQRGFRLLHFVGRTLRIPTGANKYVDEAGSGDGGGCALHHSLDRTGLPIRAQVTLAGASLASQSRTAS
jgi:hypothetical protein